MALSDFAVGVIFNLIGSVFINLGTNIVKLSHLQAEGTDERSASCCGTWTVGVGIFISGNVLNFISFSFAAQSLLAALGSVQFISNIIFGYFLLKARITPFIIVGTVVIVLGNICIVRSASRASRSWSADELLELYATTRYRRYLLFMLVLVLVLQVFYRRAKYSEWRQDPFRVIPSCYAAVSAILGSQSVLLAKSTSELIRSTLKGQDQLSNYFTYAIIGSWILTMAFWLYRMNTALRRFDSVFIVPMLQVIWTLFSIVGGGLYFDEFSHLSPQQAILFALGVLLVISGVCVLAMQNSPPTTDVDMSSGDFENHRMRTHAEFEEEWDFQRHHRSSTPSLSLALPLFELDSNPLAPPMFELPATSYRYSTLESERAARVARF
eukprot:c18188_g1_i2.p1 GENE.c18188_g1_i2~~c18188_g1_i2.p1  ORF type:complete len:382 (+),score=54.26 c18188_g1_i2:47-1192(+)